MGSSGTTRGKNWDRIQDFRVISEIQRTKFGALVTHIFIFLEAKSGAQTRISEAKFGAKLPSPKSGMRVIQTVNKFKPLYNCIRCLGWARVGIPVKRQVVGAAVADKLKAEFVDVVGGASDAKG